MVLLSLFLEFFKTGLFAVGGGMATVPFLLDISAKTNWYSASDLANMIAVSESTPGPIGVNMATYVGYHVQGIAGSLVSTIGLITPSIIVILLISMILDRFRNHPLVNGVFHVLRASVIGMMLYALYNVLAITVIRDAKLSYLILCTYLVLTVLIYRFKKVHPIFFIAFGAVFGLLFL